jgi:SAM-dependent MidA family methyltransferase
VRWREAMTAALYGPGGFFSRPGPGPAAHFRTSVSASPLFARAVSRLLTAVDEALDRPDPLDVVDVGAGRGELLLALAANAPPEQLRRLRLTAVERAPRPPALTSGIAWTDDAPDGTTGLLIATEWLDNIPLDVATGRPPRYLHVDGEPGEEITGPDAEWLHDWWPDGERAEIGRTRDDAWAAAVGTLRRGLALAVDYGHWRDARPEFGTLTGYRAGREVDPVPDGTCDLTAHVAIDSAAARGAAVAGIPPTVVSQREALHALGVDGSRPPIIRAHDDPAGYVRALAESTAAAELTDRNGLGAHWWLLQPVGTPVIPEVLLRA